MSDEDAILKRWLDEDQTSLGDLYAELAKTSPQSNAFGGDLIKQGRSMLLGMRASLHGAVCGDAKIANHPAVAGSEDSNDMIALAAIVAAVIPQPVAVGVNTTLIAALIVRIGVRRFCDGPAATT